MLVTMNLYNLRVGTLSSNSGLEYNKLSTAVQTISGEATSSMTQGVMFHPEVRESQRSRRHSGTVLCHGNISPCHVEALDKIGQRFFVHVADSEMEYRATSINTVYHSSPRDPKMSTFRLQDPLLPVGSLIFLTGANGYIATHVVDQLLTFGYAVRGSVRSKSGSAWMTSLYETRHPKSRLELVEVPDITKPGCYDALLSGVSAIIHTAAIDPLSDDPSTFQKSIDANLIVMEAAKKANTAGEKIKRVVITSSSWAVTWPEPGVEKDLSVKSFNDVAVKQYHDPNTPKMMMPVVSYVAAKLESERECWKWVEKNPDTGFALNAIMPSTCMGEVLAPKNQEYPSTAGFVRSLYDGTRPELIAWLQPQWFVSVKDAARLHIAAAVLKGVDGERIFGWAERYTWPGVYKVLEDEMGETPKGSAEDKGEDKSIPPMERSTELLELLGRDGWEGFEKSVRENIRSWHPRN
ncbi:NAD(P)-binding protein [Amniculicola lignicola CBS 123094]|uniref:NAD(P)-binding protein n=1 Tax=Amniculicola lignicola CBS 123094 TaxID=1392246 RepID=A0A6A5WL14_9PLEO|nr:NAD(P)-binding protein [Amniculicola lignicola CBS 123094]